MKKITYQQRAAELNVLLIIIGIVHERGIND